VGLVKNALSNPFSIIGTVLGVMCSGFCTAPTEDPHTRCAWVKILSLLGETIDDVISIIEGWQLDRDYCEMLDEGDSGEDKGGLGGLF
jgi:hypothetical protein